MPDDTARWEIHRVPETGSTNADLVAQAAAGAADRTVLVAEVQRAGRGRLGRTWVAPPGTALLFSVLLRPRAVPAQRLSWVGAILGLALCRAIESVTGLTPQLKWPNDVLVGGRKVGGILAELAGDAVVVGAGVNVSLEAADLPRSDATSLRLAGAPAGTLDRSVLLDETLGALALLLGRWEDAHGDVDASGVRGEYLARSATLGSAVAIHLPGGGEFRGTAVDVTHDGAIVIESRTAAGVVVRRFRAGDVEHLRTTS